MIDDASLEGEDEFSDYESIASAVNELVQDLGPVDHFIISPTDAKEANLKPLTDDLTGLEYYEVEGYKLFPSSDCPPGLLGACVADKPVGQA